MQREREDRDDRDDRDIGGERDKIDAEKEREREGREREGEGGRARGRQAHARPARQEHQPPCEVGARHQHEFDPAGDRVPVTEREGD